jgi:hypothetical protein
LSGRRHALERVLLGAAVAWLAAVTVVWFLDPAPSALGASPDKVAAGALWRLLSSSLIVDGEMPLLQIAELVVVSALVLFGPGAFVWWLAALIGHVGSALIAYALIALAAALGSGSAERSEDDWDYGISCVLAALAGVVFADALQRLRGGGRRRRRDVALVVFALVSLVGWLVTIDWFGVEHVFAFGLGAAVLEIAGGDVSAPAGRGSRPARARG